MLLLLRKHDDLESQLSGCEQPFETERGDEAISLESRAFVQ